MNAANSPDPSHPSTAWLALATDTAAMLTAAASVIQTRTARMQAAGPMPTAHDQQELALMVQEKLEAAFNAWQAMFQKLLAESPQLAAHGYEQAIALSTAMSALASNPTPDQSSALQAQAAGAAQEWANSGSRMTDAMASIADAGLKTIHATVSANVDRLGKA